MVYSASSARTCLQGGGDGTSYLVRYLPSARSAVAMQLLSRHGLEHVRRSPRCCSSARSPRWCSSSCPASGPRINGAQRWLGAGELSFQPSEIGKLALVLFAAELLAPSGAIDSLRSVAAPVTLVAARPCCVATEPDLGTALVIGGTTAAILVAAGCRCASSAVAAIVAVRSCLFALLEHYRRARLTAFLDPWADAGGAGFQIVQGQIALGSGGLFGVGLGQSVQKIFYLPEAHTDFILAVIGEEFGVAGVSSCSRSTA